MTIRIRLRIRGTRGSAHVQLLQAAFTLRQLKVKYTTVQQCAWFAHTFPPLVDVYSVYVHDMQTSR